MNFGHSEQEHSDAAVGQSHAREKTRRRGRRTAPPDDSHAKGAPIAARAIIALVVAYVVALCWIIVK